MVDYHTHTELCGHATGTVQEYIESAVAQGIREIGFSDHAPMPDEIREGVTMSAADVEPYLSGIGSARDRNEGRIEVRTGLEVDYPLMESFDRRFCTDPRLDYLIGSCHFIDGWPFDHPDYINGYASRDIDDIYGKYFEILRSLAGSGLFNIVGHFDIVKKFGFRSGREFRSIIDDIAHILAANDVAVEVNTAGMSHPAGEMYPSDRIMAILFDRNVPVTLGSDAHAPERVGYLFPHALESITRAGYRKISGFKKRSRYDIPL
ncbi:MAG TPA: histidinol-phosphatase HisJ family protein [Spirochaetota bacterium]|nr:histidinol-phosphatase HisJ family protein [Spirochaetota bacterium]HOD16162.1 histidinol-phosphatase HisJ family protein [Spirochaetota bacterium]HPG49777.1 histidinol-phosphatase HisJ family protein [Spirochaetota bacterium]HPN10642.1 histidinol-phosphatase HisJ family protein [Spirochaetota bacterium]HQL83105.1 histidinol-phosphatase HisJ family protein [Spirochaetota bacterium]